jgi:hypothetical protein
VKLNSGNPLAKSGKSIAFGTKGKGPNKRGEVINDIHGI